MIKVKKVNSAKGKYQLSWVYEYYDYRFFGWDLGPYVPLYTSYVPIIFESSLSFETQLNWINTGDVIDWTQWNKL